MATPTRRPARGAAIGTAGSTWSSPAPPLFARRISLPNPCGGTSSPPHRSNNHLPPARFAPAAVVSRSRGPARRACSCSPTTHPGSFRCALHRGNARGGGAAPASSGGLHLHDPRRSAMTNSLVRIAAVEGGDHIRRALASLVRPSSHNQRRRAAFRALPSRLCAMSTTTAEPSTSPPY